MKLSVQINLCAVFVVAAFVLVTASADAWIVLPALGCAVVMGAMASMTSPRDGHGRH